MIAMRHDSGKPFHDYVDAEKGLVDRAIFSDQAIYEMELERIFARCWNFMCHESQIPNKGDFFLTFIGEESVIATRDKTGALQVFINSCRHRGNAVCRAESGNARSFLCTYHGWTFGLDGKLIGVPGYKDLYHEDLDREQWGLISAGKVASYKGFVFATMDAEAPDLEDYLGPVGRMGLDSIAVRSPHMKVVEGVQKNQIGCNWKLAVDNLFDWYHVEISHASALMSDFLSLRGKPIRLPPTNPKSHRVVLGQYGHAIGGPRIEPEVLANCEPDPHPSMDQSWRHDPVAREVLGPVGIESIGHPNIFPNLWVTEANQLSLRLPKGPQLTEIWWFSFVDGADTAQRQDDTVKLSNHIFGPAGLLEQDDGENWDQSTRATKGVVAKRYPLNFAMNLGRGQPTVPTDGNPPHIDTHVNEHPQLWTYRAWAEWMDAESWGSLKQHSAPAPTEAV